MQTSEKIYAALGAFLAVILILGNLTYQKFVVIAFPFYRFELSVGAILYPLVFLTADLISEFYGSSKAGFCVKLAVGLNFLVALLVTFFDFLPSVEWSTIDDSTFHKMFGHYKIAVLASMLASYISQMVDIQLYLKIKSLTGDKWLWLRNNLSTMVSLGVDTSIVIACMSFFGVLPIGSGQKLIVNSYLFKAMFTLSFTPLFYLAVGYIKRQKMNNF